MFTTKFSRCGLKGGLGAALPSFFMQVVSVSLKKQLEINYSSTNKVINESTLNIPKINPQSSIFTPRNE